MGYPKIEIKQEGTLTKVFVDGHQLHGVRGVYYERTTREELPILKLELIATNMDLDCPCIPELPECLEQYYARKEIETE